MAEQLIRGNIPVPDPSTLTTEQLRRELMGQREYLMSEMRRIEEVHVEKFKSIDVQFANSKTALDAALRAQKDTAEKSEASVTKQIESLQSGIASAAAAGGERFEDLKGRMDRGEGNSSGISSTIAAGIAIVAVLIALVGLAFEITTNGNHSPPSVISAPK